MEIQRSFEEFTPDPNEDFMGAMLAVAANNKPYVFIHVEEIDTDTGVIVLALEHNAPDDSYSGVRLLLEQALAGLPE